MVINNIASLYAAILVGKIYLNVHSEANPGGEVRGQIFPGTGGRGGERDELTTRSVTLK